MPRIVFALAMCAHAFALACGSTSAAPDTDGDAGPGSTSSAATPGESSSGGAACVAGYEGCPCTPDGACLAGLTCLSNLCVDVPDAGTTGDAPGSTGDAVASSSSSGDAASSTGEPGTTTDASSSTGEPPPACPSGDTFCAAGTATLSTCVDGAWVESSCVESCAALAYDEGTCDDATQQHCVCASPNDPDCQLGAAALCYCYQEFGSPCDEALQLEFYDSCVSGSEPAVACFGDHVVSNMIDCNAAVDDCL